MARYSVHTRVIKSIQVTKVVYDYNTIVLWCGHLCVMAYLNLRNAKWNNSSGLHIQKKPGTGDVLFWLPHTVQKSVYSL